MLARVAAAPVTAVGSKKQAATELKLALPFERGQCVHWHVHARTHICKDIVVVHKVTL
jgi:hypothetical protein